MGTLFDLTGQVALVTGASRGFGRTIAGALAEAGANLVVTSRRLADVEAVAADLLPSGRKVLPLQMDVTRREEVEEAVRAEIQPEILVSVPIFTVHGSQFKIDQLQFKKDKSIHVGIQTVRK